MKEVLGKTKKPGSRLPTKLVVKKHNVTSEIGISFQMSIEIGVFPDALKIARVTPLFKGGDPSNISNYRPISILPCFS